MTSVKRVYIMLIKLVLNPYVFVLACTAFFFFPKLAHAYVDPGIMAVFFQYIYLVIFGLLALWFIRPYKYIKDLFRKVISYFISKN